MPSPSLFCTVILLFVLAGPPLATAQSDGPMRSLSVGISLIDEELPEAYNYDPIMILPGLELRNWGGLRLYAEYQLLRAASPAATADIEFGFNLGLRYRFPLFTGCWAMAAIGSGPHYISVESSRQADGFIFSDNFEAGFAYRFPRSTFGVLLRARWRHVSNAGLEEPNGGIDNGFLLIGLAHFMD